MKRIPLLFLFAFFLAALPSFAQRTIVFTCVDSLSGETLPGVVATINGKGIGATDVNGKLSLQADTSAVIVFHLTGYRAKTVHPSAQTEITVRMFSLSPEQETVVVTSTRTNSRIDDTPTKTEVLGTEEMNEENGIKPGNVSSLLGDLSSIQIQNTSAVSGQSTVRIQGLDGRYTQLLRDGLPVYDGFASGFSILQLPPQDLKQIELIKGPASTLYGAGAIGGLVNFVSREPGDSATHSVTANVTSLGEENLNFWSAAPMKKQNGYTLTLSQTLAVPQDVNNDSFSDVPAALQGRLHYRYFCTPGTKSKLILGIEGASEVRQGGDLLVLEHKDDTSGRFFETDRTRRATGELIYRYAFSDSLHLEVKGSSTLFKRMMETESGKFNGTQSIQYLEVTGIVNRRREDLIFGMNFTGSYFRQHPPVHQPVLREPQSVPGIFMQATFRFTPKIILETGVRTDIYINDTNTSQFVLPRVALLWKWNELAGMRFAAGMGYKMPTYTSLAPDEHALPRYLFPQQNGLQAETSTGGTVDVYWRRRIGDDYSLYMSQSVFFTQVDHPLVAQAGAGDTLQLFNAASPLRTYGSDSYVRLTGEDIELYLGYTWTHALRTYDDAHPFLPVTPPHRVSFVFMYEPSESWRAGVEGSWISRQYRDDGTRTSSYLIGALMIAHEWRRWTFVLNSENLLNVLQSHYEPLYTGTRLSPQFQPLWAPVDGRVINFSARFHW